VAAIEEFLADCTRRMDGSIDHTRTEFNSVRTGRASTALLAADVGEIGERRGRVAVQGRRRRRYLVVAEQIADRLPEVPHPDRLDTGERCLRRGVGGAENPREPGPGGALCGRDRPGDRPDAAVEAQLADARVLDEPIGRNLTHRGEDRQGDREIEPRPLLAERGRGKVDGDRALRPLVEGRVDSAPDAVLRLLACPIGEADDRERGQVARAQVRLDLDAARLEAE